MTAKDIIKSIMKETGQTQGKIATLIGAKGQQDISAALNRADLKVGFFVKVLNAMGYEVVVKKRSRGRKEDGTIVVSFGAEQSE